MPAMTAIDHCVAMTWHHLPMHPLPTPFSLDLIAMPADPTTGRVVVGYSGGLDSSVLLHRLACDPEMRARGLSAIHVHHGLHSAADDWAKQCSDVCEELGVPLQRIQVDVSRAAGIGIEAAAREARHRAFASILGVDDVLALAHHQDDQAETFLLRALRASGSDGLAAMRPWRRFGKAWLWRPLLSQPRALLEAYAREQRLSWIEDPSNQDEAFERNFLRQQVLPLLRERWPHADASFARCASLAAESHDLLAADDAVALASVRTIDPQVVSVPALSRLPVARRARVLRRWIATLDLPPLPANGLASIERTLLQSRADSSAEFAWRGIVLRRWRDVLHVERQRAPLPVAFRTEWNGHGLLPLSTGDTLAFETVDGSADASAMPSPLVVHARQGGERITLPGRRHSHALKHVLQDLGVPPWTRERLPLLSDARGTLMAVGDLAYSAGFDAWLRDHGMRLRWSTSDLPATVPAGL